jgi:hypothetical protein
VLVLFRGVITGIESAKLKVERAAVHLIALESAAWKYAGANLGKLVPDPDGKPTLEIGGEPSTDIPILVGEIVYQLRSALDHLTFDLVKRNLTNAVLPTGWEKRCEFPLLLTIPTFGNPPLPYDLPVPQKVFDRSLPGISPAGYAVIESLQPYHTGKGVHNVLRIIAQLSNIDKHRHFNVAIGRGAVHRKFKLIDGTILDSMRGGFKHGAQIEFEASDFSNVVEMKTSVSTYVTFDEPTVGDGTATVEVQHALQLCVQAVEDFAIPAFAQLLKNP